MRLLTSPDGLQRWSLTCSLLAVLVLSACGGSTGGDCNVNNGGCDQHAICTPGEEAVSCACKTGYAGDGQTCRDVDECEDGTATCHANALCANTEGSYKCTCGPYFTGDGRKCEHQDECADNNGGCDPNADCINTATSHICSCHNGYEGDGYTCKDRNECETPNTCDPNATCINSVGSYSCTCNRGFKEGTTEGSCVDVNECQNGTASCATNAVCTNIPGSYNCSCPEGYEGDGKLQCKDVNECLKLPPVCDLNATCTNKVGSYDCDCNDGFDGPGIWCVDIDECQTDTDDCDPLASCRNSPAGSYSCTCPLGYIGDGKTCTPLNECVDIPNFCDPNATCNKTPGSPATCTCHPGFHGLGTSGEGCVDDDECQTDTDDCDDRAICRNGLGTYSCTCPSNFSTVDDGRTCIHNDECASNNGGCSTLARCANTEDSHTCTCRPGSTGDGGVCQLAQSSLSVGGTHACAVKGANATLWCWGGNTKGQLGDGQAPTGSTTIKEVPKQLNGANPVDWLIVSAGGTHTCALDLFHRLWCWGDNTKNNIGPVSGTVDAQYNQPRQMLTSTVTGSVLDRDWMSVSAGQDHTCAIKLNGQLWCWGDNSSGQLANGLTDSTTPANTVYSQIPSSPSTTWKAVAAGSGHDCAIQSDDTLWCWGNNADGQIGVIGSPTIVTSRIQVGVATDWVSVSVGTNHTCGIRQNGLIYCWGRNSSGQLGLNDTTNRVEPTQVGTLDTWSSVQAGGDQTCATSIDSTTWCWGVNTSGQLGNNSTTPASVPTQISSGTTTWSVVRTGGNHSCGVAANKSIYCWGADGVATNQLTPQLIPNIQ